MTVRIVVAGPGLAGRVVLAVPSCGRDSPNDWPCKGAFEWDLSVPGWSGRYRPAHWAASEFSDSGPP